MRPGAADPLLLSASEPGPGPCVPPAPWATATRWGPTRRWWFQVRGARCRGGPRGGVGALRAGLELAALRWTPAAPETLLEGSFPSSSGRRAPRAPQTPTGGCPARPLRVFPYLFPLFSASFSSGTASLRLRGGLYGSPALEAVGSGEGSGDESVVTRTGQVGLDFLGAQP